jgi:hypothetical protein
MKGQYLTLEYIIFFTIGIMLIVTVYNTFTNLNVTYRDGILQNQLQMTGELIAGSIVNVYEASNSTNSTVKYNLSIPSQLSGCIYSINIISNRLNLNCTDVKNGVTLPLYNFITSNQNIIYSTGSLIKLSAKDGKVDLS